MDKEFLPYEQALALKELGFNEICCGYFEIFNKEFGTISSDVCERLGKTDTHIKTPLYQQAFRWFREKHGLFCSIKCTNTKRINGEFYGLISKLNEVEYSHFGYESQEEAELECLKKLIEMIKK